MPPKRDFRRFEQTPTVPELPNKRRKPLPPQGGYLGGHEDAQDLTVYPTRADPIPSTSTSRGDMGYPHTTSSAAPSSRDALAPAEMADRGANHELAAKKRKKKVPREDGAPPGAREGGQGRHPGRETGIFRFEYCPVPQVEEAEDALTLGGAASYSESPQCEPRVQPNAVTKTSKKKAKKVPKESPGAPRPSAPSGSDRPARPSLAVPSALVVSLTPRQEGPAPLGSSSTSRSDPPPPSPTSPAAASAGDRDGPRRVGSISPPYSFRLPRSPMVASEYAAPLPLCLPAEEAWTAGVDTPPSGNVSPPLSPATMLRIFNEVDVDEHDLAADDWLSRCLPVVCASLPSASRFPGIEPREVSQAPQSSPSPSFPRNAQESWSTPSVSPAPSVSPPPPQDFFMHQFSISEPPVSSTHQPTNRPPGSDCPALPALSTSSWALRQTANNFVFSAVSTDLPRRPWDAGEASSGDVVDPPLRIVQIPERAPSPLQRSASTVEAAHILSGLASGHPRVSNSTVLDNTLTGVAPSLGGMSPPAPGLSAETERRERERQQPQRASPPQPGDSTPDAYGRNAEAWADARSRDILEAVASPVPSSSSATRERRRNRRQHTPYQ